MKRPATSAFRPVERLTVHIDLDGHAIELGTLAWSRGERRAYFEFSSGYLDTPLPVSPFNLAVSSGLKAAPHQPFDGLHGLFNDSLPDGWGRLLLDRKLEKQSIDFRTLSPLDRLAYVGANGMGALRYSPERTSTAKSTEDADLDWFADQADQVANEVDVADIDRLLNAQGGSAGARPKIVIGLNRANEKAVVGPVLPAGYDAWIVKFKARHDPDEIGAEEYAYSLMARAAGVDVAETRLLKGTEGSYFAAARFDRTAAGRVHIHTASGLLDADHRTPQIDYDTLLKLTRLLTRDEGHVRQMFRRMVFNVLARNRDDHSKNHAFRMDSKGAWRPSPAYDLTLSDGPAGEHSLAIAGEGRNPGPGHIAQVATAASIPKGEAEATIDGVKSAIGNWLRYANAAGLSARRAAEINRLLN